MNRLTPVYNGLSEHDQLLAKEMSNAARGVLAEFYRPCHDDRAAIFDEACAVFLVEAKNEAVKGLKLL